MGSSAAHSVRQHTSICRRLSDKPRQHCKYVVLVDIGFTNRTSLTHAVFRSLLSAEDILKGQNLRLPQSEFAQPTRQALMARAFKRVATGSSGVKPWTNEYRQIALNDPMRQFLGIFTRRGLDATPIAGSSLRQMSFQLGRKGFYTLLGLPEGYEAAMSLMILSGQMSTDTGKTTGATSASNVHQDAHAVREL